MNHELTSFRGTPWRMRVRKDRPTPLQRKLIDDDAAGLDRVVPFRVRIEVAGGRTSTASAMRAARVQQHLETVGATGLTVALEGGEATVVAEVDRDQLEHLAGHPFVRRISLS